VDQERRALDLRKDGSQPLRHAGREHHRIPDKHTSTARVTTYARANLVVAGVTYSVDMKEEICGRYSREISLK